MSDGMIAASIIVYLLGLIGVFAMLDFAEISHEPWWIPTAVFWPLIVPLSIPLAGAAWLVDLIARLLYGWLPGKWQ